MPEPLPYRPAYEVVAADEAETEQRLIDTLTKIQDRVYDDTKVAARGVHAKCHGIITGELSVAEGLPDTLAQGLFARPGRFPVIMRLSTIPGDLLDDDVSVPRGLGLKVVGVPGERVTGSESESSQDFVLANGPVFGKSEPKAFANTLKQLAATTDKAPGLKKLLSHVMRGAEKLLETVGTQSPTVMQLGGYPTTHILGDEFYSQAPILYGDYMAKVRLVPAAAELRALRGSELHLHGHPDGIRQAVIEHFSRQGGMWELQVQLCANSNTMPIEDASQEWPQDESPYLTVARIVAGPQNVWSVARQQADRALSFSPWHALAAHRPLGGIMRARRRAYAVTAALRAQRNDLTLEEPAGVADLPE